ncbi:MAG: hypothetical protein QCI00_08125, partial [Candidatus Thermoplasmatota archaeon]|nr:hypothetical protein [Candidatus Thermoplasmatota archaeon]
SREIPIFNIGRSFDRLFIEDNNLRITIETNKTSPKTYSSSSIIFSSQNSQFVNQQYIYEGGAMILQQDPSSVMYGKPSFIVTEYNFSLNVTIINISGVSGSNAVSGYGMYPIYTEIVENSIGEYQEFENVTNITIRTSYPKAWFSSLNSTLRLGWSNYTIELVDAGVIIRFVDDSNQYIFNKINIREVDVKAQIAFGLTG